MSGKELFEAGRVREAIEAQTSEVKARPTDTQARYFLFVFLCYAGEFERADTQIDTIAHQDPSLQGSAVYFRDLLGAEFERRLIWEGKKDPVLPPEGVPDFVKRRIDVIRELASASPAVKDAAAALTESEANRKPVRGELNGERFEDLHDCDEILGPVLEIFAGGRAIWMPTERVRRLEFKADRRDLDLLWLPAEIEDATGTVASVHLPLRYPGSETHDDDEVRMGQSNDWVDWHGVAYCGRGQKLYRVLADGAERHVGISQIETLHIDSPAE